MIEGGVLRFNCLTTSPFHTSRREYASLLKCAPFILGSTIRGALLKYLIETNCSKEKIAELRSMSDPGEIAAFHRNCEIDCVVKPFFAEEPLVWFSFGHFAKGSYQFVTRIAIARENRSVAEGAIVNIEAIEPGTEFSFEIILFGEALGVAETVRSVMKQVGELRGFGHLRSIGFGRFEVLSIEEKDFADYVDERIGTLPPFDDKVKMVFTTPFVFGEGMRPYPLEGHALARHIAEHIRATASRVIEEVALLAIERVDARLRPDFIGRFSYERGLRENRLVAWAGSEMTLHLSHGASDLSEQLAIASILGIGEWSEWGYGRFEVK